MPLLEKDFGVGRGLLSKNETLRAYNPSWGDKIASWLMGDSQASPERRQFVGGLLGTTGLGRTNIGALDATPVGAVLDLQRASQEGDRTGMALAAAGILPGAGVAEKVAAKVADAAAPAVKEGIIAYHGSPHSFDKFDLSKIGTGEGAQAYGHGLYFAESEPVAKAYRDNLSGKNSPLSQAIFKGGKEIPWHEMTADERKLLPILTEAGGDLAKAQEIVRSDFLPYAHDRLSAELERISQQGYELKPHGSMYQVRINADPNAFLDWDRPLSEQSPHVLDRLGLNNSQRDFDLEAKLQYGSPEYEAYMKRIDSRVGAPHNPDVTGAEWYRDDLLRGGHEAERGRSAYLASQGIPGIKYLDQGSRGSGEGSRNYVVFDDSLIEILRKYGLLGAIGVPSAYSTMQQFQPAPNQAPAI